jgi:hypothetical protein
VLLRALPLFQPIQTKANTVAQLHHRQEFEAAKGTGQEHEAPKIDEGVDIAKQEEPDTPLATEDGREENNPSIRQTKDRAKP